MKSNLTAKGKEAVSGLMFWTT